MKILSIRLKNLASLSGEHFIDFKSDPLASAGLIAIIGKTGAGKSTILDAMCLALFNKMPRLKDSDGKLKDVDGSELLSNSPLTVLRRGTAHGFAEICFVAQDQKHYLARWEIKRARENVSGKLQNVQRHLKCLTDGIILADKAKAVDQQIQQITQLSFEQFTRAVLLAQSEVTAFLKARDAERGELLEYLTNSNIFSRIGQLAFEKTKEISNQRKQLESVLGHIELLSDEDITELNAQLSDIQQQCLQLESNKQQLTKQQQWFERKQQLESEIVFKQQNYTQQQQAQNNLLADRNLLAQLEIFSGIRPIVFQQQQLLKQQQQLEPQIQQQQNTFSSLSQQFELEKQQYQQHETALQQIQSFEQNHQNELAQVRKCVQERDYIAEEYKKIQIRLVQLDQQSQPLQQQQQSLEQQIQQCTSQQQAHHQQLQHSLQFASLDQGIQIHLQQLQQFIQHYQKIENSLGDLAQARTKQAQDKLALHHLVQQFGDIAQIEQQLNQKQQQRELQLERLNQLHVIQQKLQHYVELENESQQLTGKLQQLQQQEQQLQNTVQQTEQDFQTAKAEREKLQQILQQQRLLHTENIEHLRAELKHGEACLVCGSTEHPYREDDSLLSKALFDLQAQQQQQAEQQEQHCLKLWQSAQQQFTQCQTEQQQLKVALQQITHKLDVQKQDITAQCQTVQITLDFSLSTDQILQEIQQQISQCLSQKQQLEQELQQLNQSCKDQQNLQQQIQVIEHQLANLEQLQQQVQHIVQCLPQVEQTLWTTQGLQSAQQVLQQLQQRQQTLLQLEQVHQQLDHTQRELQLLQSKLQQLQAQQLELQQQQQEIAAKGKQTTETAQQLIVKMIGENKLKANEWLQQHDQQRQHCQQQYQQSKHSFEQLRQDFERQRNALEQLQVQLQHCQKNLQQCQSDIDVWLKEHTDFQTQQFDELLAIPSTQEQQLRSTLQHADRQFSEATSALNTVQQQLDQHLLQQVEIEYSALLQQLEQNQQQLQQLTEQHDQYKLKLQVHQQNFAKQQQFADQIQQIQQQEHRWSKISSLMGDANGKKFRDFAQQYHLDILLEYANQQLAMLSQRYTLKRLENSLSLAIIDHDMDGETRAVASLSGGESFLTALAISLAIANMASGSMKIESLFIDEGFGTLDASSLHLVMNALDQLQSQGRKVVLISHIQDMHERIPVQIQVQPMGSGASRIEVVG